MTIRQSPKMSGSVRVSVGSSVYERRLTAIKIRVGIIGTYTHILTDRIIILLKYLVEGMRKQFFGYKIYVKILIVHVL